MKKDILISNLFKLLIKEQAGNVAHKSAEQKNKQSKLVIQLLKNLGSDIPYPVIQSALKNNAKTANEKAALSKLFIALLKTDESTTAKTLTILKKIVNLGKTGNTDVTPDQQKTDSDVGKKDDNQQNSAQPAPPPVPEIAKLTDDNKNKLKNTVDQIIKQDFNGDKEKFKKFVKDELEESLNNFRSDFLTESQIRSKIRNTILKHKGKQQNEND